MWKYTGTKECNDFLLSLHLFEYKDEKKYIKTLYSITNKIDSNYKRYIIKKSNGKSRMIYEPSALLKEIQKNILTNILNYKSISKYAKGYKKGLSLKDNAIPHINQKNILKLDIKNFFESISFLNIYNSCFSIEYFPKSIGMLLTYLCTYNDHLIQGAPTSAYISNLVMKEFDEELGVWCDKNKIVYTRYSDDMTFSGNLNPHEVILKVKKMLSQLGLELNKSKIHVVNRNFSQRVTGLVVNEKVQVSSKYRREIRKEIYYIMKFGLSSHLKKLNIQVGPEKYLKKLYGKILYVLQIDKENQEFLKYKEIINKLAKHL